MARVGAGVLRRSSGGRPRWCRRGGRPSRPSGPGPGRGPWPIMFSLPGLDPPHRAAERGGPASRPGARPRGGRRSWAPKPPPTSGAMTRTCALAPIVGRRPASRYAVGALGRAPTGCRRAVAPRRRGSPPLQRQAASALVDDRLADDHTSQPSNSLVVGGRWPNSTARLVPASGAVATLVDGGGLAGSTTARQRLVVDPLPPRSAAASAPARGLCEHGGHRLAHAQA